MGCKAPQPVPEHLKGQGVPTSPPPTWRQIPNRRDWRFDEFPVGEEFVTHESTVYVKVDPSCEFAKLLGAEGKRLAVEIGTGILYTFGADMMVDRPEITRTGPRTPLR